MKSKLITLAIVAVLVIASAITIMYFIVGSKQKVIPVEKDTSISSATADNSSASPLSESEYSISESSISEPSQQEGEPIIGEKAEILSPDYVQMKEGVTFVKMGEPLTMHSKYYRQGEVQEEQALNLGWDGDIIFNVKKAQVLEYDKEDNSEWSGRMNECAQRVNYESPAVLSLNIEIKNENATKNFGVQYDFNTNYRLNSQSFYSVEATQLPGAFDYINEFYSSEGYFSEHRDDDDYYVFSLPPGESISFVYMFYIDKRLLDNDLYLNPVNGSARTAFSGVELDKIEGR